MNDAGSEISSMPPRPKSRADTASKYNNLSYWKARKLIFYKNGDPFFPGLEFRFKPGRDVSSLEAILDKLSLRLDLPRGARYIFSMDGERKTRLEELEDGGSFVVSSYKTFKVRHHFLRFFLKIGVRDCEYHTHHLPLSFLCYTSPSNFALWATLGGKKAKINVSRDIQMIFPPSNNSPPRTREIYDKVGHEWSDPAQDLDFTRYSNSKNNQLLVSSPCERVPP